MLTIKKIEKNSHKKKKFSQMITNKKKVRVNRGFIGWLIEVHVSSIVNWGYRDNFKSVYFFLTKRFRAYKNTHKQTLASKIKNKPTKNNKSCMICVFVLFVLGKSFCKKKIINRLEIDLIASIYYTTCFGHASHYLLLFSCLALGM